MGDPMPIFSQASVFRGSRNVPFHSHPGTELIWLRAGCCAVTANGTEYPLKPGQLLVLESEAEHNQICHGEVDNLFVVFVCDPSFFDSTTRVVETGGDVWCARLMADIADLSLARNYDLCDGIIYSLLKRVKKLEQESRGRGVMHAGLRRAVEFIEQHFAEVVEVRDIARHSGVSASHLRALFNARFHQSVAQYLQSFRMAHARELLRNRYLSVGEIGTRCGYPDANYFTRLFRKVHQCAPGTYREVVETRDPERFIRL